MTGPHLKVGLFYSLEQNHSTQDSHVVPLHGTN